MTTLGAWREIADGIYVAAAEPETVNVGLIVGRDRALVVDTGSDPAQGAAIRASVDTVTDRPLLGAVVTHDHHDHLFGLAAFDDLITVGHESLAASLDPARSELRAPNRPIVVALALDLGERRVEIAHLGRGHTAGDLIVVVPDAQVIFAGDLIESSGPPQFGPDSFGPEWAATLDGLIGVMTDATLAVPGHGDPVNREFVFEQRGRIAATAAEATGPGDRTNLPLA